jgi:hypothetical protein
MAWKRRPKRIRVPTWSHDLCPFLEDLHMSVNQQGESAIRSIPCSCRDAAPVILVAMLATAWDAGSEKAG